VSHPVSLISGAAPDISLLSWTIEPAVVIPVVAAATLYVRGWRTLARRMPERFGAGRLIAVMAGLATVIVALSSPLAALGHQLLLAHMIQHFLLMAVAPPLLWMGAPVAPMLLGLPKPLRRRPAPVSRKARQSFRPPIPSRHRRHPSRR